MVRKASPLLEKLFSRVSRAAKVRGTKAEIALHLGVVPQRLNDWLSGVNEPGGEITLRLLEWVTAAEAKQTKKRAGSVRARPALKTRNQKSPSNEKPKSSLQKGSPKKRRKAN